MPIGPESATGEARTPERGRSKAITAENFILKSVKEAECSLGWCLSEDGESAVMEMEVFWGIALLFLPDFASFYYPSR
jgi:hypothetical protein